MGRAVSYTIVKDPTYSVLPWRVVDDGGRMLRRYSTRQAAAFHVAMLGGDLSGAPEWYRLAFAYARRRGFDDATAARVAMGDAQLIGLLPSQVKADPATGAPLHASEPATPTPAPGKRPRMKQAGLGFEETGFALLPVEAPAPRPPRAETPTIDPRQTGLALSPKQELQAATSRYAAALLKESRKGPAAEARAQHRRNAAGYRAALREALGMAAEGKERGFTADELLNFLRQENPERAHALQRAWPGFAPEVHDPATAPPAPTLAAALAEAWGELSASEGAELLSAIEGGDVDAVRRVIGVKAISNPAREALHREARKNEDIPY
jgi:hypothetical protein